MNHIPGWVRCPYVGGRVPRGRARTRCPRCGAELQTERSHDWHYVEPRDPRPRANTPELIARDEVAA